MTGRRLGLLSLRIDAAYCLLLGVGVLVAAPQVAPVVDLMPLVVAVTGGFVVVWAGAVVWMASRLPLRLALRVVLIANLVAAASIAVLSTTAAGVLVFLSILAIAIDVGAFAGSQAIALLRLRARPST